MHTETSTPSGLAPGPAQSSPLCRSHMPTLHTEMNTTLGLAPGRAQSGPACQKSHAYKKALHTEMNTTWGLAPGLAQSSPACKKSHAYIAHRDEHHLGAGPGPARSSPACRSLMPTKRHCMQQEWMIHVCKRAKTVHNSRIVAWHATECILHCCKAKDTGAGLWWSHDSMNQQ